MQPLARLLLILFLAAIPASLARAQNAPVERSEDDLVLVELILSPNYLLSEAVPGYVDKNRLLLPLSEVTRALQFAIKIAPKDGQAEGYFISEDNTFSLDVPRREAVINGTRSTFDEGRAEIQADDIYVDAALLATWFPLDFNFSFSALTVTAIPKPGVLLPVQLEAERKKKRERIREAQKPTDLSAYPTLRQPYSLYTLPFADITATTAYDQRDDGDRNFRNQASVLLNHDLFYMHSSAFIAGSTDEGIDELRWTLSRRDPDGQLFAPDEKLGTTMIGEALNRVQATELAIGDVFTTQLPLTANNQNGRGVVLSNQPLSKSVQYDRTTLQGDIQPGWDVELYRNDELLSFQRASESGRYEFRDVPLITGVNILRLVFYGPYGQTREEVQRFLVSPEITKQGASYFRFAASQQGSRLVDLGNQPGITSLSDSLTPDNTYATKDQPRALFEYEYGVMNNLALFGHFAHLPTADGKQRTYLSGGIAGVVANTYLRVDGSHDMEGGNAVQATAQTNLYGVSVSAEHQEYFGQFLSDWTENVTDPLTRRSVVRTDVPVILPFLKRVNVGFLGQRRVYESGLIRSEVENRLSTTLFGRASIANTLRLRRDEFPDDTTTRNTEGEFIVSLPFSPLLLRGSALYRITPDKVIEALALTTEYPISQDMSGRVEVTRQMTGDTLTTYRVGINRRFEHFLLGADTTYADDGSFAVGMSLSVSIGADPRTGNVQYWPDAAARDGMISTRNYLDKNNDGVYTPGEELLQHANARVDGGVNPNYASNDNGVGLVRGISTDSKTLVTLDNASLENPYWTPRGEGVAVIARPGVPVMLDLAAVQTAEIEGTATITDETGKEAPASNVQIQLVDAKGSTVRDAKTVFDGFYLLESVPPGEYRLRIDPEQLERLELSGAEEYHLSIDGTKETIGGKNFKLQKITSP